MNSWDKSDSFGTCPQEDLVGYWCGVVTLGSNDLNLMKRLIKGGTEHRKFLRMVNVTVDINAPLYWWKEFDTYKVGTVANSCSTMHKIHSKEFTCDDFSHEHLFDGIERSEGENDMEYYENPTTCLEYTIRVLNHYRKKFVETKEKKYWWQMIQLLPSSYNQKRTIQLNYEVLLTMYRQRKGHKLDEWRTFCEWVETLPNMKEFLEVTK
jgi:hypothetical protein